MIKKHILIALILFSTCFSTGCSREPVNHGVNVEPYDYHNLKYQDFFSQYMRKQTIEPNVNYINTLVKSQDIEKSLNIKLKKDFWIRFNVTRVDPKDNVNRKKNPSKISKYYPIKEFCGDRVQIKSLTCIINELDETEYTYSPHEKLIPHITQIISMRCQYLFKPERNCTITSFPDYPYNLNIWIYLRDPEEFFNIIAYIEKHFYQTTGQHIWQTSPQKDNQKSKERL